VKEYSAISTCSRYSIPGVSRESPDESRDRTGTSTPIVPGTPKPGYARSTKAPSLSLSNLGDIFDPTRLAPSKLHSESQVLKAYKSASQPGTPHNEYADEKAATHGGQATRERIKKKKKKQDEIYITSS